MKQIIIKVIDDSSDFEKLTELVIDTLEKYDIEYTSDYLKDDFTDDRGNKFYVKQNQFYIKYEKRLFRELEDMFEDEDIHVDCEQVED